MTCATFHLSPNIRKITWCKRNRSNSTSCMEGSADFSFRVGVHESRTRGVPYVHPPCEPFFTLQDSRLNDLIAFACHDHTWQTHIHAKNMLRWWETVLSCQTIVRSIHLITKLLNFSSSIWNSFKNGFSKGFFPNTPKTFTHTVLPWRMWPGHLMNGSITTQKISENTLKLRTTIRPNSNRRTGPSFPVPSVALSDVFGICSFPKRNHNLIPSSTINDVQKLHGSLGQLHFKGVHTNNLIELSSIFNLRNTMRFGLFHGVTCSACQTLGNLQTRFTRTGSLQHSYEFGGRGMTKIVMTSSQDRRNLSLIALILKFFNGQNAWHCLSLVPGLDLSHQTPANSHAKLSWILLS